MCTKQNKTSFTNHELFCIVCANECYEYEVRNHGTVHVFSAFTTFHVFTFKWCFHIEMKTNGLCECVFFRVAMAHYDETKWKRRKKTSKQLTAHTQINLYAHQKVQLMETESFEKRPEQKKKHKQAKKKRGRIDNERMSSSDVITCNSISESFTFECMKTVGE